MSHNTLINGTSYIISGGHALVDGTAFSIKSGKTLVDGTAYDLGFGSHDGVTITIPDGSGISVIIDGVEYTESGTYEALESVTVTVKSYLNPSSYISVDAYVYLNGTKVATAQYGASASYSLSMDKYSKVAITYIPNAVVYSCHITAE